MRPFASWLVVGLMLAGMASRAGAKEDSLKTTLEKLAKVELTLGNAVKEISGEEEYAKYVKEKADWEKQRATQARLAAESDAAHYDAAYRAAYEEMTQARIVDLEERLRPVSY